MSTFFWLNDHQLQFPDPNQALNQPDGLLAAGGDLDVARLRLAYRSGIFPYYESLDQGPILWWSPSKRAVIFANQIHISRRLGRTLKQGVFRVTFNQDFAAVITNCADRSATWITDEMQTAFIDLHAAGIAHSLEVWQGDRLAGGLYGVAIGRVFFAESMFSHITNASKVGLIYLSWQLNKWGFPFFDCQFLTKHLQSMGAVEIPRRLFLRYLDQYADVCLPQVNWSLEHTDDLLKQSPYG